MDLITALNAIQLIVSAVLIVIVLMQAKGSNVGAIFGAGDSSIYRTRRGLEKRLFQFTILMAAIFVLLSIMSSALNASPTVPVGPIQ